MRRVVVSGPAPVQILDVAGPIEVFSNVPDYQVDLVSFDGSHGLLTSRGLSLAGAVPHSDITGRIDTLVIAGGPGAESGEYDDAYLDWIADAAARSRRVAAICTGAFLLAAAGLLDGKKAVTHWKHCDQLAREFPKVDVHRDPIFLRDGQIYTSAGITAGIDLSLALVEEDHGHQTALAVARQLVMFLVRPGGQSQYSHMLSHQAVRSDPLRELQVYMLENLKADLSVETLAERMGMSARNFSRVCLRETKLNPGQLVDRARVEAAQQMIDSSAMGLKEIADACGFGSPDSMRRVFQRVIGITPGEYTKRFKR
ncbi:transcriptional regulator GlxA family with amidase domain [Granulicella aggregans]|uniref:Transcriptional regulator GlxA family with amidase domain n=1 Tax=Granulicella aggregans TaxID=474949 RepID=A0A7W7ZEB5_9BACT|nr:helix-turn-helix domain-containing protein [Granulicella aggregans]MBB5058222.1 transcriptional regulator GlxA family with amidase domain [Granulicella aggregans]